MSLSLFHVAFKTLPAIKEEPQPTTSGIKRKAALENTQKTTKTEGASKPKKGLW